MPRRILVSTFGSAGDLFPLLPVVRHLQRRGDEVLFATRRSLGLYLRAVGIRTVALGDGSELQVVEDDKVFSTRFDGWESWRRTVDAYVRPTLERDIGVIEALLVDWPADVVVASGFAAAARIAACRAGLPVAELSIYPQHERLASGGGGFARRYRRLGEKLLGRPVAAPTARWLWGAPSDCLLHDPALLGATETAVAATGFPLWDAVPGRPDDVEAARSFLSGGGPTVVVTLGSFIGVTQTGTWLRAAEAVAELGIRGLLVGARGRWADEVLADRSDLCCIGFVPFSEHLAEAAAVVHHGGIGTTFTAVAAGRPAVVLPQAFDQGFNARLIQSAGAGVASTPAKLAADLSAVLDGRSGSAVEDVGSRLISVPDAVDAAVAAIDRRVDAGAGP